MVHVIRSDMQIRIDHQVECCDYGSLQARWLWASGHAVCPWHSEYIEITVLHKDQFTCCLVF